MNGQPIRPPPHQAGQRAVYLRPGQPIVQPSRMLVLPQPALGRTSCVFYAVIHLRRPAHFDSWGISLALCAGNVVVRFMQEATVQQVSAWCHVVPSITGHQVFQPSYDYSYRMASCFQPRALASSTCLQPNYNQNELPSVFSPRIVPGDVLLSVDGHAIDTFADFGDLIRYIKGLGSMTVVLMRTESAMRKALVKARKEKILHSSTLLPPSVAQKQDPIGHSMHQPPTKVSPPARITTPTAAIGRVRQVTPDKVSTSKPKLELNTNPLSFLARVATASQPPPASPSTKAEYRPRYIPTYHVPFLYRNPMFKSTLSPSLLLPFSDNNELDPEDGTRAQFFLSPEPLKSFPSWLAKRKRKWRTRYDVYQHEDEEGEEVRVDHAESKVRLSLSVRYDFWASSQGFSSFEDWLVSSKRKWKRDYSRNRRKRQRIEQEIHEKVHLPRDPHQPIQTDRFLRWLHVRQNQWRVMRRKRQRKLLQAGPESLSMQIEPVEEDIVESESISPATPSSETKTMSAAGSSLPSPTSSLPVYNDIAYIDEILEEQEQQQKMLEDRPPLDISFLFDAELGAPDDVVAHCFKFLTHREHSRLLQVSKTTRKKLQERPQVWQQLCPISWKLPRRPRKPWHELYFSKLHMERQYLTKKWDDTILKIAALLVKGDQIKALKAIVAKAEKDNGFKVDYISAVVCERNCILNLAVIHNRQKIVRWLVDEKEADIESFDRGQFTPLLNAAWAGNIALVRYLLQRGADRTKLGKGHLSRALPHSDFEGLTAEGWAKKRGYDEVAKLIHFGL